MMNETAAIAAATRNAADGSMYLRDGFIQLPPISSNQLEYLLDALRRDQRAQAEAATHRDNPFAWSAGLAARHDIDLLQHFAPRTASRGQFQPQHLRP